MFENLIVVLRNLQCLHTLPWKTVSFSSKINLNIKVHYFYEKVVRPCRLERSVLTNYTKLTRLMEQRPWRKTSLIMAESNLLSRWDLNYAHLNFHAIISQPNKWRCSFLIQMEMKYTGTHAKTQLLKCSSIISFLSKLYINAKRTILIVYWRSNFENESYLRRENHHEIY